MASLINAHRPTAKRPWLLAILVCIAVLLLTFTSDLFIGMELSRITQHYKLMTFGALALWSAMFLVRDTPQEEAGA